MRNCYAEPGQGQPNIELKIDKKHFPNTDSTYHDFAVKEIINNIKESKFRISKNPSEDSASVQYRLPDDTILELGNELFRIPEVFFTGNEEFPGFFGIQNMVYDSLNKCSITLKRELYTNMILTGGNSLFEGFPEKFTKKVQDLAPIGVKTRVLLNNSRKYSTWIGGSILGMLSGFKPLWITKQDYEENGALIMDKKCM